MVARPPLKAHGGYALPSIIVQQAEPGSDSKAEILFRPKSGNAFAQFSTDSLLRSRSTSANNLPRHHSHLLEQPLSDDPPAKALGVGRDKVFRKGLDLHGDQWSVPDSTEPMTFSNSKTCIPTALASASVNFTPNFSPPTSKAQPKDVFPLSLIKQNRLQATDLQSDSDHDSSNESHPDEKSLVKKTGSFAYRSLAHVKPNKFAPDSPQKTTEINEVEKQRMKAVRFGDTNIIIDVSDPSESEGTDSISRKRQSVDESVSFLAPTKGSRFKHARREAQTERRDNFHITNGRREIPTYTSREVPITVGMKAPPPISQSPPIHYGRGQILSPPEIRYFQQQSPKYFGFAQRMRPPFSRPPPANNRFQGRPPLAGYDYQIRSPYFARRPEKARPSQMPRIVMCQRPIPNEVNRFGVTEQPPIYAHQMKRASPKPLSPFPTTKRAPFGPSQQPPPWGFGAQGFNRAMHGKAFV